MQERCNNQRESKGWQESLLDITPGGKEYIDMEIRAASFKSAQVQKLLPSGTLSLEQH